MENNKAFKTCSCGASWKTYTDLVGDKDITIIGYQANFRNITEGLFLFNHETCKSTLAIVVTEFLPMYKGKIYQEKEPVLINARVCVSSAETFRPVWRTVLTLMSGKYLFN